MPWTELELNFLNFIQLWNILIYQTRRWSFMVMLNQFLSLSRVYFHWFLCCKARALLAGKTMFWRSKSQICSIKHQWKIHPWGHKLIQHQQGGPSFWTETFLYHALTNFGWPIRVLFAVQSRTIACVTKSTMSQNVAPRVAVSVNQCWWPYLL